MLTQEDQVCSCLTENACACVAVSAQCVFWGAGALLAMGGEASKADYGADAYRHDADGDEERHVKDENKYEKQLQNLSEITSQLSDNSRKTMVLAFNFEQLGVAVLRTDYSWMVPIKEINMGNVERCGLGGCSMRKFPLKEDAWNA